MTTPAEIRRRRERQRIAGRSAIGVGVLAAAAGVFAMFLEVQVQFVNGGIWCGGVIDNMWSSEVPDACIAPLASHLLFAMLMGAIALAGFVVGGILIGRLSRSGIVKVGA